MEGLNVAASMGEKRGSYRSESSIPRTAFRVQVGRTAAETVGRELKIYCSKPLSRR